MKSNLWSWSELCRALRQPEVSGPAVSGISFDSRLVEPGDLFVALAGDPGSKFNVSKRSDRDGHDYLPVALEKGAVGALVRTGTEVNCPSLQVPDTLEGLWELGKAARARFSGCPIAITGSSGKTTTKEFLAAALGAFASPGSFNNHIGVPLTLVRTPQNDTFAIYELGTNHPGEIAPLSQLVRPEVAVLLNVHSAHLEFFENIPALLTEKLSIYKGLEGISKLVINTEVDRSKLPSNIQTVTFGESESAEIRLLALEGDKASYRVHGQTVSGRVPGGGRHRAASLGAVLGVLVALGEVIERGLDLPHELVPRGRGNRLLINGITLIDDSYNANPESMLASLLSLGEEQLVGRKYALLAEMLELGADSRALHAGLASACTGIDGLVCVGENMRALYDTLPVDQRLSWFPEVTDINLDELVRQFSTGDYVLVKGSNRTFWAAEFVSRLSAKIDAQKKAR